MRLGGAIGRCCPPVPSPAVLRFLQIQAECITFLASQRSIATATGESCWTRKRHVDGLFSAANKPPCFSTSRPTSSRTVTTAATELPEHLQQRSKPASFPTADTIRARERAQATAQASAAAAAASAKRWYRPWQRIRQRTAAGPLQPNDLPPPPRASILDDNASLSRTVKPANELKLRCTEFDENGKVTLVNGAFKKTELIAKYGLLPRDLRKIDSSSLPHILVRPSAILINILHIRCLIKHNRVLVFDAYGTTDSHTQSLFMYDLEGKLQLREGRAAGALPYEFRALEAVLISVTAGLEGEFEGVREPVVKVLRELEEDIDRDKLRHLLIYSKKLGTFEQKARLVRDAIDDLLEADDDLASMYLTEKAEGMEREEDNHHEIEMLLESYHKVCDEIVQVSGNLVSNIRNTEEIVKAILDANRNSLMLLDIKFTIFTLGIGVATFFAGLYGMNLKNFIEESDLGFSAVTVFCGVSAAVAVVWGLRKLRKVQRLSMWGEGGSGLPQKSNSGSTNSSSRGSWRELDPKAQLAGETGVERAPKWKEEQRRAAKTL